MIKVNINGKELIGYEGQTILQIAQNNNIQIPTLCNDERVKPSGACGICVVEVENSPRLVRSCSTLASNGMVILTDSKRVARSRKTALELLLSDHTGDCVAPCKEACPAKTDCQGYVGLIANGQHEQALELIKDKIPLPASIGRVCPHPCEEACRRKLVEEPINIAQLKRFAADVNINSKNPLIAKIKKDTGKKVAIVGGGPGGLSAAYFLRQEGHNVSVFDAMDKMGGMLRYGIPEYRLPKAVLDCEIEMIEKMGVNMVNNVKIGEDITLEFLQKNYDAVIIAVGAWKSIPLRCEGEQLTGVVGGIDFLREAAVNGEFPFGKKVAIVGGGNTAMDACRTSVRLGALEVYNIYRRTKAEMPAEDIEILEAEEEGVVFKYLTNPIEIIGDENGKACKIRLQKMKLGEPDASGRRAPVAIEGEEEILDVDAVIIAIGQTLDTNGFESVGLTRKRTIAADEKTFRTSLDGVFAIGDAINSGAGIAIEAIGDAKKAALTVDGYLKGEVVSFTEPYLVKKNVTAQMLQDKKKIARQKMQHLLPEQRNNNFREINLGYTEEQAKKEASRCLECGCLDYFECKLIKYANDYKVVPEKYEGEKHERELDTSNPFINRNPNKCILCGLCVRVCDELVGKTAYGLVDRGFDASVKPELGRPLAQTDCVSCGQCVTVCPTGAICETLAVQKSVPVQEQITTSTCSYCSVGCGVKLTTKGNLLLRSLPDDTEDKAAILCHKGRFGLPQLQNLGSKRIATALIRKQSGKLEAVSYDEAFIAIAKKVQGISAVYGKNSVAVAISDKLTNEEIFEIKEYAENALKTENIVSFNATKSGLKEVFGTDGSTVKLDELSETEVIVVVAENIFSTHSVAGAKIKKAVENGAKLIVISKGESDINKLATLKITASENLNTLEQMAKALIDMGKKPLNSNVEGFDEFSAYLENVSVSDDVKLAAKMYAEAKKAIVVFDQKVLKACAAKLIANIAVISGHIGKQRSGIICLKPNNNSQGLADLGITNKHCKRVLDGIKDGSVKALLVFGEDIPHFDLTKLSFLMVQDCIMTETAEKADIVLPLNTAAETNGTYTSTDKTLKNVNAAVSPLIGMKNWELIKQLAAASNYKMSYREEADILCAYKNALKCNDSKAITLKVPKCEVMFIENNNTNAAFSLLERTFEF